MKTILAMGSIAGLFIFERYSEMINFQDALEISGVLFAALVVSLVVGNYNRKLEDNIAKDYGKE